MASKEFETETGSTAHGVIDLLSLIDAIVRRKWTLFFGGLIGSVAAALLAFWIPNYYRAEVILAPNSSQSTQGLSQLAGQYGGLASLAGVNLPDQGVDNTRLALEVLISRKFLYEFIESNDLFEELFAVVDWNEDDRTLSFDSSLVDESTQQWRASAQSKPTLFEAYEELRDRLFIYENDRSGLIHVAVEHRSPDVARLWVATLVEQLNTTMRERDIEQSDQSINYLERQIEKTSVAELRIALFRLVEEQMKTKMLASVSPEYVFITIDPAIAPEQPYGIGRLAWIALGCFLGLLLGALVAVWGLRIRDTN
ncbi:MAG: Wzz/FepE/Etk N-terminal domain-containing protein [Pseudomonadota bacterium]